jgi:hypothetical protein
VAIEIGAVNGDAGSDGGVAHGRRLVAFAEAIMGTDDAAILRERAALRAVLSDEAFVDAAAVIGTFNIVVRIADATGIPVDESIAFASADVREELDLARFASAANTPAALIAKDALRLPKP